MAAQPVPDPSYLSVAQVARRLGCSVSLVQKWRRLGWLASTRLGPPEVPVYGYRPEDVDRFARERWNRRRGRPPGVRPAAGRAAPAAPTAAPSTVRPPARPVTPVTPVVPAIVPPPAPAATPSPPVTHAAIRPLVLWDADPREGVAIVLARFRPDEVDYALSVATAWAQRYETLALGEGATSQEPATVLALWHDGRRRPDAESA